MIKEMVAVDKVIRCQKLGLIFNRVRGSEELLHGCAEKLGLELAGLIPFDENVAEYDLIGKPITELPSDAPSLEAVRKVVENYVLTE